jgi:hypothetical protein
VGTPVADQPRRELHKIIGCFFKVVVLHSDPSARASGTDSGGKLWPLPNCKQPFTL